MKLHQSLLALCAVPMVAAFSVPPPKSSIAKPSSSNSALYSSGEWWQSTTNQPRTGPDVTSRIEGQTRRTWEFNDVNREVVQVDLGSGGRPINANIQLWIGPDWTPLTLKAYSEDGQQFPVDTVVGTRNKLAEIEVMNNGPYELPINAACKYAPTDLRLELAANVPPKYVEGGAIKSADFDPTVKKVLVMLNTDARQLNARVEMLNGPNNVKQSFEIFTNNGLLNALYVVFTPPNDGACTIRVQNLAPVEFPCKAYITEA